jgi:2-haloalkanoic acid dehalogenase type II
MARAYEFVTFDCYGTLIDWREGIGAAFERAAARAGVAGPSREEALADHAEIEPVVQSERYRSYREVLRETALRMAQRHGWSLDREGAGLLARSLAGWPAFEDTAPALARLAGAGYRLGILSNVDRDLLDATLCRLGVEFELIVTAQDVLAYKPAHAHFEEARRRTGGAPWLHAAQSWFHDVVPACALGIPVAWVNRLCERAPADGRRPQREVRDLAGLADWLAP